MKKRFLVFGLLTAIAGLPISPGHAQESDVASEENHEKLDEVPTTEIRGILREKGTKKPLADVNVYILPHKIKATTDAQGAFVFDSVPVGPIEFVANLSDYKSLKISDEAIAGQVRSRTLYMEKIRYDASFETTVVAKEVQRDDSKKTITREAIVTAPGAGGDALRATQNLAGINRSPAFTSNIVIQGAELESTTYLIDGHEVPLIFHFGGLSTVVFSEAIDSVEFYSAGYGPERGRALGGLVGVRLRSPRTDRVRGLAYADVINAGGLVEGGITEDVGFLVSVRQSYIGEVLKAVIGDSESLNFTVAPRYSDATALVEWKVDDDTNLRVTGVGSLDRVEFLLKEPAGSDSVLRGNFDNSTKFFRLIPQFETAHSEKTKGSYSLGVGWTSFQVETDQNFLKIRTWTFTPREEITFNASRFFTLYAGTDSRLSYADVDVLVPSSYEAGGVFNPFSTGEDLFVDVKQWSFEPSLYLRPVFTPDDRWTFSPGARFEYFSDTGQAFVDPRLSLAYRFNPALRLRTSGGLYHQEPQPQESSEDVGNPNLITPSAWHLAAAADVDLRQGSSTGWTFSAGPFARWFNDLVVESTNVTVVNGITRPEYYNNSGDGVALGAETTVKYSSRQWEATLAYTLLRSRRTEPLIGTYPAQYDQTHNVNLIAGVNLPKNWRISTRIRYVTGNPYTPIADTAFDADNAAYIPIRGPFYSERVSAFFQTDLRADKRWIFNNWILALYLDIQNVTNRQNVESIQYAYDFSDQTTTTGLPIIPSFGIQGEF